MSILIKTALKNIKKNQLSIGVLFFFITCASTVFLSSENLKNNISKSTLPYTSPFSSLHDFVISTTSAPGSIPSSSFDSSFVTKPEIISDLNKINAGAGYAWKFSLGGNVAQPFNKEVIKTLANTNSTASFSKPVFKKLHVEQIFKLPNIADKWPNFHHENRDMTCKSDRNFLYTPKKIVFNDKNEAAFAGWNVVNNSEFKWSENTIKNKAKVYEYCNNTQYGSSSAVSLQKVFMDYFRHWRSITETSNHLNDLKESTKDEFTDSEINKKKKYYELTNDEAYKLEQSTFNKTYWSRLLVTKTETDPAKKTLSINYFPFIEKDIYLDLKLNFSNNLINGRDINQSWQKLISKIKNSQVFYSLDETTKNLINTTFDNKSLFSDYNVQFFIGNVDHLNPFDNKWESTFLPHFPSVSWKQQQASIYKFLLWDFIKKNKNNTSDNITQATITNRSQINNYFEDLKKNKYQPLLNLINEMKKEDSASSQNTQVNIIERKMLGFDTKDNTNTHITFPTAKEFIFGNLSQIDQKFESLKSSYSNKKDDAKYEKYESTTSVKGGTVSGYTETSNKDATLKSKILDSWESWIKNEHFEIPEELFNPTVDSQEKSTTTNKTYTSSNSKKIIPSHKPQVVLSSAVSAVLNTRNAYETTHWIAPTKFESVFETIKTNFIRSLKSYISNKAESRSLQIKTFLNNNNLFKLSFLAYNFKYSDNPPIQQVSSNVGGRRKRQVEDNFELNTHRSAVISNSGALSASLKDPNKLNHKFKVILSDKENSKINNLKIIEGNPLFVSETDNLEIIRNYKKNLNKVTPSFEITPLLRLLTKVKFNSVDLNELIGRWEAYFSDPHDMPWEHDHFFNEHDYIRIQKILNHIKNNSYNVNGSKISFDFNSYDWIRLLSTIDAKIFFNDIKILGYIEEPTSYFGVVSPEYARINNITPISNKKYLKFKKLLKNPLLSQASWEENYYKFLLDRENHNSIINVNTKKIIVVGIGASPDFLFPAHSWLSIIPNKETEALLYVNKHSFENLIFEAKISFYESYISFKFPANVVAAKEKERYLKHFQEFLNTYISNDLFSIVPVNASNKDKSLFSIRSKYSDTISNNLKTISNILLGVILSIVIFVLFLLVKKYIKKNMNIFGIFIINGTSKTLIILSACIYALVPSLIAAACGYFLSLFLQATLYSLVSNYWFLPFHLSGFDFFSFVSFLIKISLGISLITYVAASWLLKADASKLIKENSLFTNNRITKKLYEMFSKATSLWKFRFSVIFNALNQTVILTSVSIICIVLINFLLHNVGKIQEIQNAELASKQHGYDIQYHTPTEQAGQFYLQSYSNMGNTFVNKVDTTYGIVDSESKKLNVKYGQSHPEVIASNISSQYHKKDFGPVDECLTYLYTQYPSDHAKAILEFSKYAQFSPSFPYKFSAYKVADHYLLRSDLSKATSEEDSSSSSTSADNKCTSLKTKYTSSESKTKKLVSQQTQIFNSSKPPVVDTVVDSSSGDSSKNIEKFAPKFEIGKEFDFAQYIPLKNEDWGNEEKKLEMYGSEPLFKSLSETYTANSLVTPTTFVNTENTSDSKTLKSWYFNELDKESAKKQFTEIDVQDEANNSKTKIIRKEDFWTHTDTSGKANHYPTLGRLYKDHANYWIISLDDFSNIVADPSIFKNKVITRFLLDHTFEYHGSYGTRSINVWQTIEAVLKKMYPELVSEISHNHQTFMENLLSSKYAKYFVTRFMNKHPIDLSGGKNAIEGDDSSLKNFLNAYKSGSEFNNKASYAITKEKLDSQWKDKLEEGLYYISTNKIFYFYDELSNSSDTMSENLEEKAHKHENQWIIYRPDFLYLFYAIMKDPEFLKEKKAPVKFVFNFVIYQPDADDFTKSFDITGIQSTDSSQKLGLVAEDSEQDPSKNVNGDQTYTYLEGEVSDNSYENSNISITGLKKDARGSYFKLLEGNVFVNDILYKETKDGTYPIIINKFAAKQFNLKEGSILNFTPKNHYTRFTDKLSGKNSAKKAKLRVAKIYDSYFKNAFLISQKNANIILGLNPDYGFNGIFTKKQPLQSQMPVQLSKVISAYAKTGIFTYAKLDKGSHLMKELLKTNHIKTPTKNDWANNSKLHLSGYSNQKFLEIKNNMQNQSVDDLLAALSITFGNGDTQSSMLSNVGNNAYSNETFFNIISDSIVSITNIFMTFLMPLLILTIIIITYLILDDLKNLLVILKLLGFTPTENAIPVILYLSSIMFISSVLGTIITVVFLKFYINLIFINAKILLPITISFKHLLSSCFLISFIFLTILSKSFLKIKNIYMPIAMKSLTD